MESYAQRYDLVPLLTLHCFCCFQRLERLLGVNGPSAEKKRAKLNRELEEEDGLGPDFGAFLAGLDRLAEVTRDVMKRKLDIYVETLMMPLYTA